LVKPHFFEMMIFWRPGNCSWGKARVKKGRKEEGEGGEGGEGQ
jgi:hypothetical protein